MPHFHFSTSSEDGSKASVGFHADNIFDVLEKFKVFLNAADFPGIDEVIAVSHDQDGNEDDDIYYYNDGTALTGAEIDAENSEQTEEGNA